MTTRLRSPVSLSSTSLACLLSAVTHTAQAALNDLVRIVGVATDSEGYFAEGAEGNDLPLEDAKIMIANSPLARLADCKTRRKTIGMVILSNPALTELAEEKGFGPGLAEWTDGVDCKESPPSGDFTVFYSTCSMTMFVGPVEDPFQIMRWTVPPESSEAEMVIVDSERTLKLKLESALEQLKEQGNTGKMATASVTPLGEKRTMSLPGGEYETELHRVEYVGRMSPLMQAQSQDLMTTTKVSLDMIKVESTGTAWIAADVPGLDVIRAFYDNFERYAATAAGTGSLMGGMVQQMSKVAAFGLPLSGTQTSKVGIDLSASQSATLLPFLSGSSNIFAGGMESTSGSTIKDVRAAPWAGTDLCAATVIPEGLEVVDLNETMTAASPQAAPGAESAEAKAAMDRAMQEVGRAMDQMTPQQKAMMQNLGLGIPGASARGGAAAASKSASSAELMTGDVTQSVQRHLKALGYDPGNTDGNATTETVIAISQFQAEKGLEVTGEASPQLLGILSAEADRRRGN
jgi:hypothetical protein